MIARDHLELLRELGTAEHPHSGRTFLDHLRGTCERLESWGNPREVCLGGLFHSIYGTRVYRIRSVELEHRDRIRDAIGERAEELAYLFCVTDRREFWSGIEKEKISLRDLVHDRKVTISRDTLASLLEIEVANILDQLPPSPRGARGLHTFAARVEAARDLLSQDSLRAVRESVEVSET